MKLIIDIGNTKVKTAIFEKKELKDFFVFEKTDELLQSTIFEKNNITNCIISTVVNEVDNFTNQLKQKTKVLLFTAETKIPINNLYQSASTLGSDRLAASVGANALFPNKNILIIDCGTCIKYNFVNNKNEYIGGAISLGLQMRFNALNTFTARLPLIQKDENFNTLIGTNTTESILSGVEMGVIAEVKGFIEQYEKQYTDMKILLTGGDVNFFAKRLKNSIFADQFLILKGLNEILDFNIDAESN